MERFLSVQEAAQYLGVSISTIYRWLKDKRLPIPTYVLGRRRLLAERDLQAMLARRIQPKGMPVESHHRLQPGSSKPPVRVSGSAVGHWAQVNTTQRETRRFHSNREDVWLRQASQ